MRTSPLSKSAVTVVSIVVLFSSFAVAQLQIGSSNTAFAEPPIPHPNTTPCKVTLYSQYKFNNYNSHPFTYTPPADCPGPWAAVILTADFSVTQGVQYDRTANIWIGPTNIYFGTTSEPSAGVPRHWHVERDLTDYSSIFLAAQDGTVDLGNTVNSTYNGVLVGTATVDFYPLATNQIPPDLPEVIGFSAGSTGGTVTLNGPTDLMEETLTLPTNITGAYLDVFAQGQGSNDEFWYTCVPNSLVNELESCGGTAFRESEITIDGTPAGVAPVYPWIFTGGIDPDLWIPIPGVQTMNFRPYRVNLTPFASLLDNGQSHTIALSVFNDDVYFEATANLLLYLDANVTQVTGDLTENTLTVPSPTITTDLHTGSTGNVNGTVNTVASHSFQISGYINTSEGPVTTTVAQDIKFSNLQSFKVPENGASFVQNIKQDTTIKSVVTTKNAGGTFRDATNFNWPLTVDISAIYNSNGTAAQTTSINQYYERDEENTRNGQPTFFSLLENRVTPTDTLFLIVSPCCTITGNQNQSSAQNFFNSDSSGYCYSENLTAANNVLTGITNGRGCN
jgi:peptide N-acetyl-beta-D-glucosaminyl asparaginase amidase A